MPKNINETKYNLTPNFKQEFYHIGNFFSLFFNSIRLAADLP